MSYLLDTASYIWFVTDDAKLSKDAKQLLEDPSGNIFLSLGSIWEMAIKSRLGRGLDLPLSFHQLIDNELEADRFQILSITISHLKRVADLPLFHRDPFDRLLIAQSQVEGLPIITNDAAFDQYQVQRIW